MARVKNRKLHYDDNDKYKDTRCVYSSADTLTDVHRHKQTHNDCTNSHSNAASSWYIHCTVSE